MERQVRFSYLINYLNKMSTHSMARVISESSMMVDYFDEERERLERKKLKALSKEELPLSLF